MSGFWKSDAICLRLVEYSNTSIVATFLTRERGKVSVLAKGARRRGSAFYGELDVLTRSEIVCIARKRSSLHTLSEVSVADTYRPLRHELARLHAGLYVIELVRESTVPEQPNARLFELTVRALERVARNQKLNPLTIVIFELLALEAIGLGPRLDECAECGDRVARRGLAALPDSTKFGRTLGGPPWNSFFAAERA